jgi:uncharacterized protein YecE (DUF72 family)
MDFGKLQDISAVHWDLPPDEAKHWLIAPDSATPTASQPRVYVGCTGWSMPAWVGGAYPPKAKSTDFLKYYAQQFNTIEQNGTYYRMPDAATVARWVADSPSDFRFCPKVPQMISNAKDFGMQKQVFEEFATAINGLGERLGVAFMQLPQHAGPDSLPSLERFLDRQAGKIPLAIEARHPELFAPGASSDWFFAMLSAYKVGAVITDVSGRRDVLHMRITTPQVLIRFVGNGLVETDYQRMNEWITRWESWFSNGVESVYCFTHEPENLRAPEMSAYTVEQVRQRMPQALVRGPQLPFQAPIEQLSLF